LSSATQSLRETDENDLLARIVCNGGDVKSGSAVEKDGFPQGKSIW